MFLGWGRKPENPVEHGLNDFPSWPLSLSSSILQRPVERDKLAAGGVRTAGLFTRLTSVLHLSEPEHLSLRPRCLTDPPAQTRLSAVSQGPCNTAKEL